MHQRLEQLGARDSEGDPLLELRLGGLYALERIAKSNEDYHPQIMEVLCAYVRMRSREITTIKRSFADATADKIAAREIQPEKIKEPETDIQAVMTVIGRRNSDFDGSMQLDLAHTQLSGCSLVEANLVEANLVEANLVGANLVGANLSRTNFLGANLRSAEFLGANLSEASLFGAYLDGANLSEANLVEAFLLTASVKGVIPKEKHEELIKMQRQQEAEDI